MKQTVYVHAWKGDQRSYYDSHWYWTADGAKDSYERGGAWRIQKLRRHGEKVTDYLFKLEVPYSLADSEVTQWIESSLPELCEEAPTHKEEAP